MVLRLEKSAYMADDVLSLKPQLTAVLLSELVIRCEFVKLHRVRHKDIVFPVENILPIEPDRRVRRARHEYIRLIAQRALEIVLVRAHKSAAA